jgi:voltage-gated potassium channel
MGAVMYLVEGKVNGFTSIPKSMYWAVVTMTTVGYGDLVPQTNIGKLLASFLMIMGYAIIAVPTGIVTAELTSAANRDALRLCSSCKKNISNTLFRFCPHCGVKVEAESSVIK